MKNSIFALVLLILLLDSCDKSKEGYSCNSGNCEADFDNPKYLTLSDCESACSSSSTSYNCVSGNCQSVSSGGTYSNLSDCESTCGSSSTSYNCVSGNCQSVSSGGTYLSLSDCESACVVSTSGYNCINGNCQSVSSNAQYPSLSNCQNACGPGTVKITATWNNSYSNCNQAYLVTIGLAYTSTDASNNAFFAESSTYLYSGAQYSKSNIDVGTYYYKATKTFNTNCGTGQGVPSDVIKTGAFDIESNSTTTISISLL
jgi:hypothetical protein